MLSTDQAKELSGRVLSYSTLPECEVDLTSTETVFLRFANNGITTSGYQIDQKVSVTSTTADGRTGNAVINELSDDLLRRGVVQAEDLAKISKPDPEHVTPLGPQKFPTLSNFDSFTANARGDVMIPHVAAILDTASRRS